ncbi:hypothetical protein ACJX0J_021148, partial [Zea mays]
GEPERRKEMDMPTPPQLAGVSPAAVYFSGGGASGKSRRKRPREECVSLFTVQPQQSTAFASVALFQTQNMVSSSPSPAATALVSTGLRLAFDEQQQQQESKQTDAFGYPSSPSQSGSVSDELAAQVKRHDEEIDRFVREQ